MSITKKYYGKTTEGTDVYIYTLSNSNGMSADITCYGGIIVSLNVPDRNGKIDDVVLGYDKLDDYLKNCYYFGAIIGRHANRIEDAHFELNGETYALAKNLGKDHLHGGIKGFDKAVWRAETICADEYDQLVLSYRSIDGEENYPGNLDVRVVYTITDDSTLKIQYFAISDKDTVVNLTNHSYFNLSGHAGGDVLTHELMVNADRFTVIDENCMPTGEIREVKGTPLDLNRHTPIGSGLSDGYEQIACGNGYDHNWILNVSGKSPEKAAELYDPKSGRVMEVYTSKPGMQVFTADFSRLLVKGKGGAIYDRRNSICFETQYFPNAMKHKHFPSPILKAGEHYNHSTVFKFL